LAQIITTFGNFKFREFPEFSESRLRGMRSCACFVTSLGSTLSPMASPAPAPAQPNLAQTQNGNNNPHVNGNHRDQQFKSGRNPPHKKDYVAKRDNGNQDPRAERRRRDREDNEANGSPVGGRNEEYRGRRGRNTRDAQANGNANVANVVGANGVNGANGNHVKAEANSHIDQDASKPAPDHIDGAAEQLLVDELQEKFPQVPVDSI
jgi:hypothetical protein